MGIGRGVRYPGWGRYSMLSSLGGELSSGRIYTATPDNSLIVPELKNLEYGDRLRLKSTNIYCGRER